MFNSLQPPFCWWENEASWSLPTVATKYNLSEPKTLEITLGYTHTLLINTFPKALLASAPPKRAESSKFDGRKSSATETEACYLSTPFPPPAPRIYHTHTHTPSHRKSQQPPESGPGFRRRDSAAVYRFAKVVRRFWIEIEPRDGTAVAKEVRSLHIPGLFFFCLHFSPPAASSRVLYALKKMPTQAPGQAGFLGSPSLRADRPEDAQWCASPRPVSHCKWMALCVPKCAER